MKKTVFAEAINGIDPFFVEEALHYTAKSEKTRKAWSLVRIVAPIAACLAVALTVVFAVLPKKEIKPLPDTPVQADYSANQIASQTENASQTQYEGDRIGHEIVVAPKSDMGKLGNGFYVGVRYWSFCTEKSITIDFFMSQDPGFGPNKYYADFEGYPYYKAIQYLANEEGEFPLDQIEGHRVILNGCEGQYEKRFSRDDLSTILGRGFCSDVSYLHKEEVTIDFSSFEVGESFSLILEYGYAFSDESSPYYSTNEWRRFFLHFYVGEKGVAVSDLSWENAIKDYKQYEQEIEGREIIVPTYEQYEIDGFHVWYNDKEVSLQPLSTGTKTVQRGSIFTDRFELISFVPCEQYKIKIETGDGVNLIGDDEYFTTNPFVEFSYQLTSDCTPYGTILVTVYGINGDQTNALCRTTVYCVCGEEIDCSSVVSLDTLGIYSPTVKEYLDAIAP